MHRVEYLKKCTEWNVSKNARKGKFQKMHGMEYLKNTQSGIFKKMQGMECVKKMHGMGSLNK